jgi:hypothetical protein
VGRPGEIGSVSYYILLFLWLKFFIMWRFARFWALLDGLFVCRSVGWRVANADRGDQESKRRRTWLAASTTTTQ